jgi:hypothetical protein
MATRRKKSPVETLPVKYQDYFNDHFGKRPKPQAHLLCCSNLTTVSKVKDEEIGDQLAELAKQAFADRDPLTTAEDRALRSWPADQLRVFREGLRAIFGDPKDCPNKAVRAGKFSGKPGHRKQSLQVHVGKSEVKITFFGP